LLEDESDNNLKENGEENQISLKKAISIRSPSIRITGQEISAAV
jgi:hypothetical protein